MSDIVERLRGYKNPQETLRWTNAAFTELAQVVSEAADKIERMRKIIDEHIRAGAELIAGSNLLREEIDRLTDERNDYRRQGAAEIEWRDKEIERLRDEAMRIRADAASVVYAYDCAAQLIEALISFLPEGQPLDPRVATAKHNLDEARRALQRPATPSPPAPIAGSSSQLLAESAMAIEELSAQRNRLIACLQSGQILIDTLMTELRHNAVLPLGPTQALIVAHQAFRERMEELLKNH